MTSLGLSELEWQERTFSRIFNHELYKILVKSVLDHIPDSCYSTQMVHRRDNWAITVMKFSIDMEVTSLIKNVCLWFFAFCLECNHGDFVPVYYLWAYNSLYYTIAKTFSWCSVDGFIIYYIFNFICTRSSFHNDVIKWKHFPHYWPFVRRIHRSPVNSPHKGQWRGALMFSLIWAWMNDWVNNREPGDLRRHRAHYDVTVMSSVCCVATHSNLW